MELDGLRNIVAACRDRGARRLVSLAFLGNAPEAPSAWVRAVAGGAVPPAGPDRWDGWACLRHDDELGPAARRVAPVLGAGGQKMRNIAIAALVYSLVGVLHDPRAVGRCCAVGCDDVLTGNEMLDLAAEVLGRPHPRKLHVPRAVSGALAPLIERLSRFPHGSIRGIADCLGLDLDLDGDPRPIRALLPRPPQPYRAAVAEALTAAQP